MKYLDKDKWNQLKFSNIADCIERHDKNPLSSNLSKFIGLEHIESSNLKIKETGNIEDGTTFSKTFQKGDVLFGKRRAYLRKVAVADFDGICSGDILVFRPKKEKILPDLLPLYVMSDAFINYAISTSAGSLSPRTKWRDLAQYQILLPPIDKQEQIADLFHTIDNTVNQLENQKIILKKLCKQLINGLLAPKPAFGLLLEGKKLKSVRYCDVAKKILRKVDPLEYGIERIVAGENLETDDFKIRSWGTVGKDFLGPAFHVLFIPGDILYGSRRTYLRKVALAEFEGVCANTTFVIRANEEVLSQGLLKHIMLSERFTNYSIGVSKGSTNPYINWKDLDNFSFSLPDLITQQKIVEVLDGILAIIEECRDQEIRLQNLKSKLLNDVLS